MAKRRGKQSSKQKATVPAIKVGDPTPEQRQHADYVEQDIIHAESFNRATVHRIRQQSSLRKLCEDGQISEEQLFAAQQIAHVAEMLERNVSVRCASLEARVDHAGSARDVLVERLGLVRMEVAYSKWRTSIAMPRRMIVDMVLEDRSLFTTARVYRVSWPKAKRLLGNALDHWCDLMTDARRSVDEEDLLRAQTRACA